MSFRNHATAMIGAATALTATFGLSECVRAQARITTNVLYVAATGGRYNWTRAEALNNPLKPYDNITHAAQNSAPDDTIEVGPGTYTDTATSLTALVSFKSYLTIRPRLNTVPLIKGNAANNYAVVRIDGSDHILFTGFEIDGAGTGPRCAGILMVPRTDANGTKPSHDIQITKCKVHGVGNGGIISNPTADYLIGNDYVTVDGNEIYDTLGTGPDGASGISLHQMQDRDVVKNTLVHNFVQNNIIYDNVNRNTDLDAKGNIDLKKHTDGNGIILDTNDFGGQRGPKTLIQNNLVYRNGGRGIHVFFSSNVTVLNNTVYGNNLDPYLALGGELTAGTCDNVLFSNNVVQGNDLAPAFAVGLVSGKTNGIIRFKNTTYTGCSALPPVGNASRDRTNAAIDWPSTITHDPAWGNLFVNASTGNFHLRTLATRAGLTSLQSQTALNRGSSVAGEFASTSIDGTPRAPAPGGSVDRGAYEQSGEITVTRSGYRYQRSNGHVFQTVILTAIGGDSAGPISLVLDNLTGASLVGATGTTSASIPSGSPYINTLGLLSDTTRTVTLEFTAQPTGYTTRVLVGSALR